MAPSLEDQSLWARSAGFPGQWSDDQIEFNESYGFSFLVEDVQSLEICPPSAPHPFPPGVQPEDFFQSTFNTIRSEPAPNQNFRPFLVNGTLDYPRVVAEFTVTSVASAEEIHAPWLSTRGLHTWTREEKRNNRQGWVWAVKRTGGGTVLRAWIINVHSARIHLSDDVAWVNCIHYDARLYITLEEAVNVLALCLRYKLISSTRESILATLKRRRWIVCGPDLRAALISHADFISPPRVRCPLQGFMEWVVFECILTNLWKVS